MIHGTVLLSISPEPIHGTRLDLFKVINREVVAITVAGYASIYQLCQGILDGLGKDNVAASPTHVVNKRLHGTVLLDFGPGVFCQTLEATLAGHLGYIFG